MVWHFPLQGVFPTQGANLYLLHCKQILYCWATGEAPTTALNRYDSYCTDGKTEAQRRYAVHPQSHSWFLSDETSTPRPCTSMLRLLPSKTSDWNIEKKLQSKWPLNYRWMFWTEVHRINSPCLGRREGEKAEEDGALLTCSCRRNFSTGPAWDPWRHETGWPRSLAPCMAPGHKNRGPAGLTLCLMSQPGPTVLTDKKPSPPGRNSPGPA